MSADASLPILPPGQITAEWMTKLLERAGYSDVVTDISAERVGTGQVGESYRFFLGFAEAAPRAPETLIGKFPASDPTSRAAGVNLGNYVREVRFYRELQASAWVSTPRCLYAEVDATTCDFVLIMEDLAPAEPGDQLRGLSVDAAALALDEAAKLHASHWNDPAIDAMDWISDTRQAPRTVGGDGVAQLWRGFLERYGDRIRPEWEAIGAAVVAGFDRLRSAPTDHKCLIHIDYRPDNMMFGTDRGGRPLTILDWQSLGWGRCTADVSYFMAGAVSPSVRRANERALLKAYLARLKSLGVDHYDFDALWKDYALSAFGLFNMGFIASMLVERTPRGDEMFLKMVEGGAALVQDLGAVNLLQAL